jgi:SAM-dependent methyltransferase
MNNLTGEEQSVCPLCHNSDCLEPLVELPLGHVYACSVCSTSTFLPTPSEEQLKSAYQKFNVGELAREEFGAYVAISKKMIERDLKSAGVVKRDGLTMLDYGCGGGHFVQAAEQLGIEAAGIDLDEEGARFGRARGLRIGTGDHRNLANELGDVHYDVILMMHVLEHVPDPGTVFRALRGRLKDGGVFIVRVPDQSALPSKWKRALRAIGVKRSEWGFVHPPIHLHGFTGETFRYLAKANDLDVAALYQASPLDTNEYPTTKRYWHGYAAQRAIYRLGKLFGSGGYLTAIMRAEA